MLTATSLLGDAQGRSVGGHQSCPVASPLQARSPFLFVTGATPAGAMGHLSTTKCTYLPTPVPLELSGQEESVMRYVDPSYRTENYQWPQPVMENGVAALQVDLNNVQLALLASKEQDTMQLCCSRYFKITYRFYWSSMGGTMLPPILSTP